MNMQVKVESRECSEQSYKCLHGSFGGSEFIQFLPTRARDISFAPKHTVTKQFFFVLKFKTFQQKGTLFALKLFALKQKKGRIQKRLFFK